MKSFSLPSQQTLAIRVAFEPIYNVLNSFSLLTATERLPGLNTWLVRTAAGLTPERRHANRLVFEGLRDALTPEEDVFDVPGYLKNLAEQDAYVIRDRVLERLSSRFSRRIPSEDGFAGPDMARLLSDVQAYLTCIEYVQVDVLFDPVLQTEIHALLNDAPALHHLIVSHLEELWKMFAAEWKRGPNGNECNPPCAGRSRCLRTILIRKRRLMKHFACLRDASCLLISLDG